MKVCLAEASFKCKWRGPICSNRFIRRSVHLNGQDYCLWFQDTWGEQLCAEEHSSHSLWVLGSFLDAATGREGSSSYLEILGPATARTVSQKPSQVLEGFVQNRVRWGIMCLIVSDSRNYSIPYCVRHPALPTVKSTDWKQYTRVSVKGVQADEITIS